MNGIGPGPAGAAGISSGERAGIAHTMSTPAMQRHPIKARNPTPSLPDRLERLAQLSLRLGTMKSEPALLAAIAREAARLLGAQRVLLVLQAAQAKPRIAGSKLPAGESADSLLQAVTPWLDEAVGSGASRLRHGPAGVEAIHQRSCLVAPLLSAQGPLGCLYADVEGSFGKASRFEDAERGLLAAWAAQAGVALAHLRATSALQEEIAQRSAQVTETVAAQQATAEVLQIIGSSMGDLGPVFDAIAAHALRLCGAQHSVVARFDGEWIHEAAFHDAQGPALNPWREVWPQRPGSSSGIAQAISTRELVEIPDVRQRPGYVFSGGDESHAFRSLLAVPLLNEGKPIGAIGVLCRDATLFSAQQKALLQTFANQAVIAMENARLLSETHEALEQQTATSEVLQVIAGSMADAQPVFDKILESCVRLFSGATQALNLLDDDGVLHLVAVRQIEGELEGWDEAQLKEIRERTHSAYPIKLEGAELAWMRRAKAVYGISDVLNHPKAGPAMKAPALAIGFSYAQMGATMFSGDRCIGSIVVNRPAGMGFSDKEKAQLMRFADQAVVAIQNARLFNETQEALEQQKASSDVLEVISQSMGDSAPVFEAILQRCERLIDGVMGTAIELVAEDGRLHRRHFRFTDAARQMFFVSPAEADATAQKIRMLPPAPAEATRRFEEMGDGIVVYPDVLNGPGVPKGTREFARAATGGRASYASAGVPMFKDGRLLGLIGIARVATQALPAQPALANWAALHSAGVFAVTLS